MKYGFIGCGKMGSALLEGILRAGIAKKEEVMVHEVSPSARQHLQETIGISLVSTIKDLAKCDILLLCVKPQDAIQALKELGTTLEGKLLVSIAAGVTLEFLENATPASCRVVRVMPNTPAMLGRGATAIAPGSQTTKEDQENVLKIFQTAGIAFLVSEDKMDAVTGLSGSGPAYIYLVIEALADAGVQNGLSRDMATQLAAQTVAGAAQMVLQTQLHPATLKDMVTSPGGTTIEGLRVLEAHATRSAFIEAVTAATERSHELSKN